MPRLGDTVYLSCLIPRLLLTRQLPSQIARRGLDLLLQDEHDTPEDLRLLCAIEKARERLATAVLGLSTGGLKQRISMLTLALRAYFSLWMLTKLATDETEPKNK